MLLDSESRAIIARYCLTGFLRPQLGGPNVGSWEQGQGVFPNAFYEAILDGIQSVSEHSAKELDLKTKGIWRLSADEVNERISPAVFHKPLVDWRLCYNPQFTNKGNIFQVIYYTPSMLPGLQLHAWGPTNYETTLEEIIGNAQGYYEHDNVEGDKYWRPWVPVCILKISWIGGSMKVRNYKVYPLMHAKLGVKSIPRPELISV